MIVVIVTAKTLSYVDGSVRKLVQGHCTIYLILLLLLRSEIFETTKPYCYIGTL